MKLRYKVILSTIVLFALLTEMRSIDVTSAPEVVLFNPYKDVDWKKFGRYKANLHSHSLQSDGYHKVKAVVNAYKRAGYSILAITDHDWNWPNARLTWGHITEEEASPYPLGRPPKNYPANTTWPWTDYGGPAPDSMNMVGIQAGELTFRHHMNSYFSDYGVWYERTGKETPYGGIVDKNGREVWEDDQLSDVRDKKGLAVINHPGIPSNHSWWQRKSLDWYVDRFKNNSAEYLVGMEVVNNDTATEKYDEGLWDQLLARFMPGRPIWGFGNDDMHTFETGRKGDHNGSKNSFTVFLLDTLNTASVRTAMEKGQFYFCKSTRQINLRENDLDKFPSIQDIEVNEKRGTITIKATNYDQVRWISAPASRDPVSDYNTSNQPWPLGEVVYEGLSFNYRNVPRLKHYVRIELQRILDGHTYRTFTNPIGFATK